MQRLGPADSRVPVKNLAKVVSFVGVLIDAAMNSAVLGRAAAGAQRYAGPGFCATNTSCRRRPH
ncbi:hypothetical protein ACK8N7_01515 [Streptomyces griseobrunneus]